jgi:hypothetical protein
MIRLAIVVWVLATPGAATAQPWNLRDLDIPLDRSQVLDLTAGRVLIEPDDGKSKFLRGGAYVYSYPDGGATIFGRYMVQKDGRVCIDFGRGRARCDLYVRNRGILLKLTEQGGRFPLRIELGLKP